MQPSAILVHYAEIATKRGNRPMFIRSLEQAIRRALADLPIGRIKAHTGRVLLYGKAGQPLDGRVLERLRLVFGISSFSPVFETALEIPAIKNLALAMVADRSYESFRISARRAFKDLPFSSLEVNREVGAHLLTHKPAKVMMKGAELELHIEMLPGHALLYTDKLAGLGGLPMATGGRVVCLLSGGIDSPVAAFRMMRRGCQVVFVHFHSHPFQSRTSQEKALELAEHLTRFQGTSVLYRVPFGDLQREIVTAAPARLRVILYRRFMLRLATHFARQDKAKALVTGESLAQVASQTLDNLVAIDQAVAMPILRPLIGFDKQEIITQAEQLGTYTTSILPDEDCCQLFTPKHPETRAVAQEVDKAEQLLNVEAVTQAALERTERLTLKAPWLGSGPPDDVRKGPV